MENDITFDSLPQAVAKLLSKVEKIERLLSEKDNSTHPPGDELLTIQQAADMLHLSVPTVYGLNHRSLLPGVCKKGKRLYFLKQGILDYIKSGQKQTIEELSAGAVEEFRKANKWK